MIFLAVGHTEIFSSGQCRSSQARADVLTQQQSCQCPLYPSHPNPQTGLRHPHFLASLASLCQRVSPSLLARTHANRVQCIHSLPLPPSLPHSLPQRRKCTRPPPRLASPRPPPPLLPEFIDPGNLGAAAAAPPPSQPSPSLLLLATLHSRRRCRRRR